MVLLRIWVSIPLRYAKNHVSFHGMELIAPVSIPLRYAKNGGSSKYCIVKFREFQFLLGTLKTRGYPQLRTT